MSMGNSHGNSNYYSLDLPQWIYWSDLLPVVCYVCYYLYLYRVYYYLNDLYDNII